MTKKNKQTTNELEFIPKDKKARISYLLETKVNFIGRDEGEGFKIKNSDNKNVMKGFLEAFGSYDIDISHGLVNTLTSVLGEKVTDSDLNFAISFIKEQEPNNPIEAMLAIQMLGNHLLSCKSLCRANLNNQSFEGMTENINRATKLQRTFIAQMDALKKFRNKGNQKITVEHINVNEGGKAVIGSTINNQINNKAD